MHRSQHKVQTIIYVNQLHQHAMRLSSSLPQLSRRALQAMHG